LYDFRSHRRLGTTQTQQARPIVVLEGMLILTHEGVRDALDVRVFVDAPEPVRLKRRLTRDVAERGRDLDGVAAQFSAHVKPMHDRFIQPSRVHANRIYSGERPAAANVEDLLRSLQRVDRGRRDG
jgi:uridine kinase